ncbi:flagellar biosynthesis protein FlhF [Alcaligenaceae bacterium CGII-47]|nr:flagellar biosynthesis protein FlhF [Alcaligenaceae bacterium CGII-47]
MNISRFFGATNREVMRQVRLALGPEALIISNKRVNGGVEILATDQTSMPSEASATAPANPERPAPAPSRPVARPMSRPAAPPPESPDVVGAIGELRGSLESRIDELLWGTQLRRAPQAVSLFQSLLRFGFSTALLRAMLKRLPEQHATRAAFQWARNELIKHLPVLATEDELWQPGLALALVGPTGVGKTTTIAKLAARCVRRSGPDSLVLLTTDTYRIGAHEQLKIYGQMLRVPVHIVQDVTELRRIVQGIRPDQTILIDNVGISQRDRYIADQAALLANAGRRVSRLLVLNASSHGDTLDEVARSYTGDGGTPLRGCIITKIDEASRLGAALDTAIRYQLPIHYVSNGQKVPENLLFLSALELIDQALVHLQNSSTLYAPTEADMAALLSMAKTSGDERDAQATEHQRALLPGLLSVSTRAGDVALSMQDLQAAVGVMDENLALSEGYDLWRSHAAGSLPGVAEAVDHLARVASNELADTQAAYGLLVHGRSTVQLGARRGSWAMSAWLDPQGRALAASTQQLGFSDGWHSSTGKDQLQSPAATDALALQIQAVMPNDVAPPLLHIVDGGGQALWRTLAAQGRYWLAQCGAKSRVFQMDGAATLSAVCQSMDFRPLARDAYPMLVNFAGVDRAHAVLWVGSASVQLCARLHEPLNVTAVCLRVIDARDGRLVRTFYGLGQAPDAISHAGLASALLIRAECHGALRQAAAILPTLVAGSRNYPGLDQALYATQLSLAAWHLRQETGLAQAADVAARMLGARSLSANQAYAGLVKLYTLKELLA